MSWLQRLFPPPTLPPAPTPEHCQVFEQAKDALDAKVESVHLKPAHVDIVGVIVDGMRETGSPRRHRKKRTGG